MYFPHIFYKRIIHTHCLWTLTGYHMSIISDWSSRLHLESVQSCCRQVLASWPTLAHMREGVHRSTSLMSSSLLLQQCPACIVRLVWMVCSCCFVRYCLPNLFNTPCSNIMWLPSAFFSIRIVSIRVVHPYISIDMTAAWIKLLFYRVGLTSIWSIVYQ